MRRTLAIVLLLAGPAMGQAPEPPRPVPIVPVAVITAPASIPAGAPLVVFADQSTSSSPVSWKMKSPRVPFEVASLPGRPNSVLIIRQPAPGTVYQIALIAFGTSEPGFDFDFADVAVGLPPTPTPQPPTPPGPPAPVPVPVPDAAVILSDGWHATLVINGLAPPAELLAAAPLSDSPTVAQAVKGLGGVWHKLDTNSAEYVRSNLDRFIPIDDATGAKVTTPALVIQDAAGKVLKKAAAPKTEAELLQYLASLKGGR